MIRLFETKTSPHACVYLPHETSVIHYELVAQMTEEEYEERMVQGWRRFGFSMFRPACPSCQSCLSMRVAIDSFQPNRSQRRAVKANQDLTLSIGPPEVTQQKLDLYDRFHTFQSYNAGWSDHGPKDPNEYEESFVLNPTATEEWCYYLGDRLLGVGYVDALPNSLSAIYFFHEPEERQRSLGTLNVMQLLASAQERGLAHIYLGYFVDGCRSLQYKANFQPNEILLPTGEWVPYRS